MLIEKVGGMQFEELTFGWELAFLIHGLDY